MSGAFNLQNFSIFPGAYFINSIGNGCMPVFWSIPNFSGFLDDTGDREDCVIVMPGYKIILWFDLNYSGTKVVIDNTSNSYILVAQSATFGAGGWSPNNISSCQLYYENNLINNITIS
jgi:hypothetical protein